eukprot:COSAG01_NODE_5920_length_3955_cov_7.103502_1_plen_200_part_00
MPQRDRGRPAPVGPSAKAWEQMARECHAELVRENGIGEQRPPPPLHARHWACWLGFACATSVRVCPEIEERPAPVNARPCQPPVCGGCARPWPSAAARSSRRATRATRTICTSTLGTTTANSEACAHRCGRSSCTASEGRCADSVGSPSRQRLGHRPFCRRLRMALANRDRAGIRIQSSSTRTRGRVLGSGPTMNLDLL